MRRDRGKLILGWGLTTLVSENAVAAWGARAVYIHNGRECRVDLLPDRQDSEFAASYSAEERKAFFGWINGIALPWLGNRMQSVEFVHSGEIITLTEARFLFRAKTTKHDNGFVYLLAEEVHNEE